jgi:hypothetical protein
MLPVIVMHSREILATCSRSRKMAGNLLVLFPVFSLLPVYLTVSSLFSGNYDISKMHYEGPGNVPGAPVGGYAYDIRVEGHSSANPPEISASA